MSEKGQSNIGARFLMTLAALTLVIAGLKAAQAILVPFVVAMFLAMLGMPALVWFQRHGLPKWLAVTLVVFLLLGLMTGAGMIVGGSLDSFTNAMPRYRAGLEELVRKGATWLETRGVDTSSLNVVSIFDPGQLLDLIGGTLRGLAGVLSRTLLVILTMVFLLFEAAGFPNKFRLALGLERGSISRLLNIADEVQRYLTIKTLISLATGLLLGLWVYLCGLDFPWLWGLVAFLLNFIPSLGSIIAAVPPIALALIQLGPGRAAAVAAGYLAVNLALGNILEPRIIGRQLGLSTLVVFLSLVFWGWVWGPVGMLLSVPLTIIVKIMLENSDDFHWVAVLLGPDPGPAVKPHTPPPVKEPSA